MFDWNDEELNNIIWDEDGETDDHIVPYKERSDAHLSRKEWSQESKTSNPTVQKPPGDKIDLHGRKLESSSNYNATEGISSSDFGLGSWPESSLSKAAKTDSISAEVSNNLAEPTKYGSTSCAKASDLGKGPDIFQSAHESKEQGDFVDYSWANIGSFDDLDRIFSNDVPIFDDGSLGSADKLWPSSKDATNSQLKSFSTTLDSPSMGLDIKSDYQQQHDQQFSLSRNLNDPSSHSIQNVSATVKHELYPGLMDQPTHEEQLLQTSFNSYGRATDPKSSFAAENFSSSRKFVEKAYQQKKLSKFPKRSEENCEVRALQDPYGACTPSQNPRGLFDNQLAPSVLQHSSSMVLNQQKKLQVSETSQYPHMSNPYMASSAYGNLTNPYTGMPVLSSVQHPDPKNQLMCSYEVSPGTAVSVNKSADAHARPLTMTPQEKIEKLRRRQQMQAMLAIQRQQQQFRPQVPGTDQNITQKCSKDNQLQFGDGANLEDVRAPPSFDPNSPLEQDDSNAVAAEVDDNSAEYSVLYRLQDVVANLDIGIRLCIRDSLFRLAQSAMQRHNACNTTSTNKISWDEQEVIAEEEARKSNRYAGMPDAETATNSIDRTVAHLLFHKPLELSVKLPETPESSASTRLGSERNVNFPMCATPESSKIKQDFPQQGFRGPCALSETQKIDLFETSPCIDTSENVSAYGPAGSGEGDVEASQ